jgi:hypothetical protein
MTIKELLIDVGLPQREIGLLIREITTYNVQHPDKPVPALDLMQTSMIWLYGNCLSWAKLLPKSDATTFWMVVVSFRCLLTIMPCGTQLTSWINTSGRYQSVTIAKSEYG